MAYEIAYDLSGQMRRIPQWKRQLRRFVGAITVIGVIVALIWVAGADWPVTVAALDAMAENLVQGSGLQEAFSGFCLDILQGA